MKTKARRQEETRGVPPWVLLRGLYELCLVHFLCNHPSHHPEFIKIQFLSKACSEDQKLKISWFQIWWNSTNNVSRSGEIPPIKLKREMQNTLTLPAVISGQVGTQLGKVAPKAMLGDEDNQYTHNQTSGLTHSRNIWRCTKGYMIQLLPTSQNTSWTILPIVLRPHWSSSSSSSMSN